MSLLDLPKDVFQYMNFNPLDKASLRATCRGLREKVKPNHEAFMWCTEKQFRKRVFGFYVLHGKPIDYLIRLMALYGNGDTSMLDWCLERGAKITEDLFRVVALQGTILDLEWTANHGNRFCAQPIFCLFLLTELIKAERLHQIALILYERLLNEPCFDKDHWDGRVMHISCLHHKKKIFEWTLGMIAPTQEIIRHCIRHNYVDFVELMLKSDHDIEIGQDELDFVSSDKMRDLLKSKKRRI